MTTEPVMSPHTTSNQLLGLRSSQQAPAAGPGGLPTVPPLTVHPGPRGLSRVSPFAALRSAARSDEFQTAKFASGGSACSGLDSEPPAARHEAGAGRHGLPQQTATTNERRPT
jgi:hypothetical protein